MYLCVCWHLSVIFCFFVTKLFAGNKRFLIPDSIHCDQPCPICTKHASAYGNECRIGFTLNSYVISAILIYSCLSTWHPVENLGEKTYMEFNKPFKTWSWMSFEFLWLTTLITWVCLCDLPLPCWARIVKFSSIIHLNTAWLAVFVPLSAILKPLVHSYGWLSNSSTWQSYYNYRLIRRTDENVLVHTT